MDDEALVGHGVRVRREGDRLVVISEGVRLGFSVRRGRVPGTAVRVGGELWEVVGGGGGSRVERWVLERWPEGEAVRRVAPLDVDAVRRLAIEQRREAALRRRRVWLALASPLLGFAPGELQRRWEAELGYPAMAGVLASGLAEIAAGAFAVVHLMTLGFAGAAVGPAWLTWLMVPAPLLLVEGMARLHHANAHGEPVGSILGAPFLLLDRRGPGRERSAQPAARQPAARWILDTTLLAAAVCFAPRDVQERWGARENTAPWIPTAAGAGLELLGGVVDLLRDGGLADAWSLISLFLVAEGLVRLGALAATRRPVGSLLGVPLIPLYRRRVP